MLQICCVTGDKALAAALQEQSAALANFSWQHATAAQDPAVVAADVLILDASLLLVLQEKLGDALTQKTVFAVSDNPEVAKALPTFVQEVFIKPFYLGALLDRVQFHARLASRRHGEVWIFAGYRLEPHNRQIIIPATDEVIRLTEKETALLEYLAQSEGVMTREDLLSAVWGYDDRIDTHTLETHMYQLRRKLDPQGERGEVLCNDGCGYYLRRE